jgi:hypothetical protein
MQRAVRSGDLGDASLTSSANTRSTHVVGPHRRRRPDRLATSIMLSRLGISLLAEKHADTATHPKAAGISTRAMGLFRQWRIDERVPAAEFDGDIVNSIRTALGGPELQKSVATGE